MPSTGDAEPGILIPGTSSHFLEPIAPGDRGEGRLRYLSGGTGAPLVLLHTVRTQAEHFRHLIALVHEQYTVMGKGWAPSFEVLKLYAERHAGLLSTSFELGAEHPVGQAELRAYFDRGGELGAIERSGDDYVLVGLTGPVPGCVLLACLGEQDGSSVSRVAGYLYGPDGPAAVDGVRENVDRWLRAVAPS